MFLLAIIILAPAGLRAQPQPPELPEDPEQVLKQANALAARFKCDSALLYFEPLMAGLEQRGQQNSSLGLRVQLAMSNCWKHSNREALSMQRLNEVKDKSQQLAAWDVFVKACLALTGMHSNIARKEAVKTNLNLAYAAIKAQRLDSLYPDYAVALATWHGDFGFNDSLKHYTRLAMDALKPVDRPYLQAAVHTLDFYSVREEDYQEGIARLLKTVPIYKKLNDNIALSRSWYKASLAYYRGGDIEKSIVYNDSTIAAYYQAIAAGVESTPVLSAYYRATGAGREDTPILSAAYLVRGRAYRRMNRLDSALYYTRRGYTEEIRFIKQQEKYAIAEAAEKYQGDKQERQLKEKAQELAYERQRTTGLILISCLTLFFASLVVYAYSQLRKSNEVAESQARKLREANENLGTALNRQLMLRAEIHHRVKNNLQIISSLLQSQAEITTDERVTRIISGAQERIVSMSLIHQNLYQSDDLNKISLGNYLNELITNIRKSHTGNASLISFDVRVEDEFLDINEAIPLGLILNELITNAYKYAFSGHQDGRITIELSKTAKRFKLKVSDNGVGLPINYDLNESNSLGLKLVTGLVRQLEGKIRWSNEKPGTTVSIEF